MWVRGPTQCKLGVTNCLGDERATYTDKEMGEMVTPILKSVHTIRMEPKRGLSIGIYLLSKRTRFFRKK
jgi:hypothetical protein